MFKLFLKKVLPKKVINILKKAKNLKVKKDLKKTFYYDYKRYVKHSDLLGSNSRQKLVGKIIRKYHVIEKGLTMPETRLGFGKDLLITLIEACLEHVEKYGSNDEQVQHAISVILEYENFHKTFNYQIDSVVLKHINKIRQLNLTFEHCDQINTTKGDYFSSRTLSFDKFAKSRSSIRNYSLEDLPLSTLTQALTLAQTTPSACNRQCWRSYVYTNKTQIKEILNAQGGNRGFGHLTNKLIVIAAEVGVFHGIGERNEAYIDGGMYAMNLLYSLHYYQIGACILNCSNSIQKDKDLRRLCEINDSEVFIAMIACGGVPDNFKIASSKRYKLQNTNQIK